MKRNLGKKFKTYSMRNLSQKMNDILLEGTKTPSFYAKPKTHETYQEIQLFRPICNGIGSYFVCMPEFIDSFFQPLSRKNNLYVKDTTDFLNEVSKIHNSPET